MSAKIHYNGKIYEMNFTSSHASIDASYCETMLQRQDVIIDGKSMHELLRVRLEEAMAMLNQYVIGDDK